MPYSDQSMFPKGKVVLTAITNAAQAIFTATGGALPSSRAKVSHIDCANPDIVANTLIFRAVGAGAEVVRVSLNPGDSFSLPGFEVNALGLEVLTSAAITTVGLNITAFYLLA